MRLLDLQSLGEGLAMIGAWVKVKQPHWEVGTQHRQWLAHSCAEEAFPNLYTLTAPLDMQRSQAGKVELPRLSQWSGWVFWEMPNNHSCALFFMRKWQSHSPHDKHLQLGTAELFTMVTAWVGGQCCTSAHRYYMSSWLFLTKWFLVDSHPSSILSTSCILTISSNFFMVSSLLSCPLHALLCYPCLQNFFGSLILAFCRC